MLLKDFDYFLPKELIAQKPIQPRDHSRLMILNRQEQTISHDYFYNLGKHLRSGDVLVANNSRVIPARLLGRKQTDGRVEVFLLRQINDYDWQVLTKNCKLGDRVVFQKKFFLGTRSLSAEIIKQNTDRTWEAHFNLSGERLLKTINYLGQTPTPPYIKRKTRTTDYQTVYAQVNGSVAAPTAGFHFTPQLIQKLSAQNINLSYLTLHVGLGTFLPVSAEKIEEHHLHEEWAEITPELAEKLNVAKKNHQRIVAVGTTSVRTLESFCRPTPFTNYPAIAGPRLGGGESSTCPPIASLGVNSKQKAGNHFVSKLLCPWGGFGRQANIRMTCKDNYLEPGSKWTNIFIYPGYQFKFVDAMITNFHLPKSSLLMLVSAFAGSPSVSATGAEQEGREFILRAYQEAIKDKYRFYSFGDAMLIL